MASTAELWVRIKVLEKAYELLLEAAEDGVDAADKADMIPTKHSIQAGIKAAIILRETGHYG